MHRAGRVLRWLGTAFAGVVAVLLIAFGLLQTRAGQGWLARSIAQAASGPGFTVSIEGLGGFVPFRVAVDRIDIADGGGTYLTLRRIGFAIAPADLLAGRLHIRWLSVAEIDMARSSGSSRPLADYLRVPHLPVAVALDRLSIGRLALAPPVLGEAVAATVAGDALVTGDTERISVDLDRTDGRPGKIALRMLLTGTHPALRLRLTAAEPTGIVLDRLLGRTDRLPLALALEGAGPVTDWHGRLTVSAGSEARIDADAAIAVAPVTVVGLSGEAAVAPLLPAALARAFGDSAKFSLHTSFGKRTVLDRLSLDTAAGTFAGDAAFGGPDRAVAAHLRANLPDLSRLSGLAGTPLRGSAAVTAELSGSENRPALVLDLAGTAIRFSASGAAHAAAHVSAIPTGPLDQPDTRIAVTANGRIDDVVAPGGMALAAQFGRTVDWALAAAIDRTGRTIDFTRFSARGGGLDLSGSGHLSAGGGAVAGRVEFAGAASGLRTGIAAADALSGGSLTVTASVARDQGGVLSVDRLVLAGHDAKLTGTARFDPASRQVAAAARLEVAQLQPLGAALGTAMAGTLSAQAKLTGPVDRLRLDSTIEASGLAAAGGAINRLRLSVQIADLAQPKAVLDGSFHALGLDGNFGLVAEPSGASELTLSNLRLTAADSAITGNLQVALAGGLVRGSLQGHFPDLARWSGVAGNRLGGSLDFSANLDSPRGGQGLDFSATGTRLAAGAGSSRIEIGHATLSARLADIRRLPSGIGRVSLDSAHFGAVQITTATAQFETLRPGRFAFQGDAKGQKLALALAGEAGLEAGGAELRLTRLAGTLGRDPVRLEQPLTLSRRGADLAFSGLALRLGTGRVTGSGSVKGETLALSLNAVDLPLAPGADLLGYRGVNGSLSLAATLGGTRRAPRGHLVLNAHALTIAMSGQARTGRLGLAIEGDWTGRAVDLTGRVTGLAGDRISFDGSLPLLWTPAPLGISVPPQGRLALRIEGAGQIDHLADLLPLGEDRLSGNFAADIAVGGTVAAPAASGRLRLSGARYANFATGAVLTGIDADVEGDRDRFRLTSFSAGDGAGGKMTAQGSLVLSGAAGPTAQLSATLVDFRLAARDEAVATASGTVKVAGPLASPEVTARLTVDRADINLPDTLPPSVVVLKVTEVNGAKPRQLPPKAVAAPALPATLDIALDLPGRVIVRGHGLDSEWHGRLKIAGTSAAPRITGSLTASRGSFDLLGKSFRLTRGTIAFDGSARLDPTLDIVAEASAADITAQILIGGLASAPTIALTSTPLLPKDEILARVLFNRGVGQITAGEGLQLASAAATLSGRGPGVLDRLRGGLGLDWLRFGQGPAGAASPILNPSVAAPSAKTGGTALSAGKYIAPGVSVGVTQGVSPPTSKVTVEIELGHHVTVDTEAGQSGGTGIGLNYRYDY